MNASRRGSLLAAMLLSALTLGSTSAAAFELFGIRLWGEAEDDDRIEVIDPLPYTVTVAVDAGEDEEDLDALMKGASALWSDREEPASGKSGLLAKARGDYRRILAALYGAGYYGGTISITAAGQEVAGLDLGVDLPPQVPIAVRVDPGLPFAFGRIGFVNPPRFIQTGDDAVESPATEGFVTGERARASVIGRASALAIEQWRQLSYAKAEETGREVIADHGTNRLDATIALDPGRPARFGPVEVEGSRRVVPSFTAFMADIEEGARFDPDTLDAAQTRLSRLGVFRSLRVVEAEAIGPDGSLPITISVEDRRPRTIGFGASLSTIDGAGLDAYWEHRNLFGRAEQLRVEAGVAGLGQTANPADSDYNLGVTFTKPGVYTPDTSFVSALEIAQDDLETYQERSITTRVGLSQEFDETLTGDLFLQARRSRVEDDFGVRNFLTLGPVVQAAYDRRDDPLEPTSGYYAAAEIHPFYETEFSNFAVRGTLEGRTYFGFGEDDRFVIAGRALLGALQGPDSIEVPPAELFFAGGGGSVRGYEYRSIGVEEELENGDTTISGGKGLFETSLELRTRITNSFGAVGFVDAGYVTRDSALTGDNELKVGAGLGIRYFTGIGAIRADVAAPLNPGEDDPAVALYIGIGQSF